MRTLSLNVPKPCTEKWANFSPTSTGGFCASCSKVVTDFTGMSDEQIITFLSNSSQHVCGRFRPDQLKTYVPAAALNVRPGFTLLRAGVIGLFILLVSKPGSARMLHEKAKSEMVSNSGERIGESSMVNTATIVTGIVRYKYDSSTLPGVNVLVKGRTDGTATDANGRFVLHANVQEGDVLVFAFIGFETQEYKVTKIVGDVLEINIEMDYDTTALLGELLVSDVYQNPHTGIKGIWNKMKSWF